MKLSDQKIVHANGKTYIKRSTIGWQLCCQWRDDSTSWENLADLKESHPIETAKYAMILGIDHEPAFNWWVPHVLKKRDRIISLVRKRNPCYLKRMHKFGIELPKTVKEAFELDRKNGNTLWADAIAKEMSVGVYIVMVGTGVIEIAFGAISIAPQQSTDHILAGQTAT
jgi:hypothetical protein